MEVNFVQSTCMLAEGLYIKSMIVTINYQINSIWNKKRDNVLLVQESKIQIT